MDKHISCFVKKIVSSNSVNFAIIEVSSLNSLLLRFQMLLYILALIILIVYFTVFQSVLFIAYKKYCYFYCNMYLSFVILLLQFSNLYIGYRNNVKLCCITHRALSLGEHHYLKSLLSHRLNSYSLRSFFSKSLMLPLFNNMSNSHRSFAYVSPFIWNHLPNTVHSSPTYLSFIKKPKNIFFNKAFIS